ncbi:MAG: NAD(P)/FAD-dependent oxidoreductase [Bacteroidetes bacterium]|nr:MAG: NAD(P)/FAD-dependent oxidoreductase [Bacteroidota bacterium]
MSGRIVVIGGGAAGFFSAIRAKEVFPDHEVIILEKSQKTLSKVKVSGGGRCNVTNVVSDPKELSSFYPRGQNFLKKAFSQFTSSDTVRWFEERGIKLKVYPDNCIFPVANNSQVIIDCFRGECERLGVQIEMSTGVQKIIKNERFKLTTSNGELNADKLIVTIGGQPKKSSLQWLEEMGHTIIDPVPSLFTFNMPDEPITELMGNVIEKAKVKIKGEKLEGNGPLLITHWGMSGPAILQLSAWGARILHDKDYHFEVLVNWLDSTKESELREQLTFCQEDYNDKHIGNVHPFPITLRLWKHLLMRSGIKETTRWRELGKNQLNKLVNTLINDCYQVKGKTTFKEEFVTAGGVSLQDINVQTMESKKIPGMYFAGEVMDIDGITGGFNFQAAWTTAFIAGSNVGT